VSPGWFDVGVQTGDPGFEHREDLRTVAAAAAKGGFTAIAPFPNTQPPVHSKSEILYIRNTTAGLGVHFYPIGAVSQDCAGKDMAELYDMHAAGAVAFSDGKKSVQDAGLLLRSMQYARAFNGLILNEPHHKTIAAGGQMHEGTVSTSLGLKGLPSLAEEIMVQRDLSLLEYSEGRLHIHLVSSAKSVDMIRAAKKAGLQVTCSVAVANLFFTDGELRDFDSNWKLLPPLRAQSDADALLEGLTDGTIDFIVSNHSPWDDEAKNLEFPYADFGMIGLESVFALCRTFGDKKLPLPLLVEKLSLAPRRIFGLPVPEIKEGEKAELTVFDPTASYTFSVENIGSKSRNTPFLGRTMQGKVLGTIV
jgi:dihydroorotase